MSDRHIVNDVMRSNQTVIADLGPGLSKSEEAISSCGWGREQGREGRIMSGHKFPPCFIPNSGLRPHNPIREVLLL